MSGTRHPLEGRCRVGGRASLRMIGFLALVMAAVLAVLIAGARAAPGAALSAPRPSNDQRADAQLVEGLPARVGGTTIGATVEEDDPSTVCAATAQGVWYQFRGVTPGKTAVALRARGQLEAVVAVYRRDRSHLTGLGCSRTDARGLAGVAFRVRREQTYLVLVAQRSRSIAGNFELRILRPERPEQAPGRALAAGGTWSSVDRLLDPDDVWAVELQAGTVYRLNLVHSANRCLSLGLYRPGLRDLAGEEPLRSWACGGYATFAPGPDGGGQYSMRIRADRTYRGQQAYRLELAAAEPDDTAPGVFLESGQRLSGSLSPRTIDTLDMYRFVAPRPGVLAVDVDDGPKAVLDLLVVTEEGKTVECKCAQQGPFKLRLRLLPEHYYLAVRAKSGPPLGYRMLFFVRDTTSTALLAGGLKHVQVAPGTGLPVLATVRDVEGSPAYGAAGGVMRFQFDRLDPFVGWNFVELARVPVGADGSTPFTWTPPSPGRWRSHAVFFGTSTASPSSSGYVFVDVEEPLVQ